MITNGVLCDRRKPSEMLKPHGLFLFLHDSVAGCPNSFTQFVCWRHDVDRSRSSESDVTCECVLSHLFCRYISFELGLVVATKMNENGDDKLQ
jgi:hypothetical protein